MWICVYIYIYIYIHVHVCVYVYIYIYIYNMEIPGDLSCTSPGILLYKVTCCILLQLDKGTCCILLIHARNQIPGDLSCTPLHRLCDDARGATARSVRRCWGACVGVPNGPGRDVSLPGRHYLSNATCLIQPYSFYMCFIVSRTITFCYSIYRF